MDQQEPVDFESFLQDIGQHSIKYGPSLSGLTGPNEPLNLAALLNSAEETSARSLAVTACIKSACHIYEHLSSCYRERILQDWRIASMESNQFRATGKIAFFEMKTFLITAETAALLQKSAITQFGQQDQLSQRDQRIATVRMRSIVFAMKEGISPAHFIPLPTQIKGFPSLSRVILVIHGQLSCYGFKKKGSIYREVLDLENIMSLIGVPTSTLTFSLQIHTTAKTNVEERLSREVFPLLRTRARLLGLEKRHDKNELLGWSCT